MKYQTKGTCSTSIDVEVEDGIIKYVEFFGGCNGNLKGIASLVTGMKIDDAISKLKGIRCGFKTTSCPDQLAQALEKSRLKAVKREAVMDGYYSGKKLFSPGAEQQDM